MGRLTGKAAAEPCKSRKQAPSHDLLASLPAWTGQPWKRFGKVILKNLDRELIEER